MTQRARRILALYLLLAGALAAAFWIGAAIAGPAAGGAVLAVLGLAQGAPYLLAAADWLLGPMERRVKAGYRREAEAKLARLQPYIIAITGSYGKTSAKHILGHILSSAAPTLATPGSVNTEMGIARVVREELEPRHRYFLVEMGAYGPGSIARLCALAPPRLGLILAVGWAHYERFKSLDTVFDAKFELADAVAANGGTSIVNADAVPAERLDERLAGENGQTLTLIGKHEKATFRLHALRQTAEGLQLTINEREGGRSTLTVPLFGAHQGANILAAVAAARSLGMPMDAIKAALANCPQVRHRLEVYRSGGIVVIDDAYNSNPVGFASALEVLDELKRKEGGRAIVITPGMVELGAQHEAEHARLGEAAAGVADIALVVTPERIESFVEAFEQAKAADAALHRFAAQADAEAWLKANTRPGDVVLFENNLPDLYEARPRF